MYRAGESLSAIYVIHSGSFKSLLVGESGGCQITGIHLQGQAIGIEGIASGQHTHSVIALEDSVVCVIPIGILEKLAMELPGVQHWLHRVLSREIVAVTRDMTLLGCRKAEERLAAFLLDLSRRFAAVGHSPSDFDLRMTRQDIANHLGLSAATVSRAFAHLGREGVIRTCQQHVRLLDIHALSQWASGQMVPA